MARVMVMQAVRERLAKLREKGAKVLAKVLAKVRAKVLAPPTAQLKERPAVTAAGLTGDRGLMVNRAQNWERTPVMAPAAA